MEFQLGIKTESNDRKRLFTYIGLVLLLLSILGIFQMLPHYEEQIFIHTISDLSAVILAFLIGIMSLISFNTLKNYMFLFIGTGYLGTAILEIQHLLLIPSHMTHYSYQQFPFVVLWTWISPRIFLAVLLCFGWYVNYRIVKGKHKNTINQHKVYLLATLMTIASVVLYFTFPYQLHLPREAYKILSLFPMFFFLVAFFGFFKSEKWKNQVFVHWLMISVIFSIVAEFVFILNTEMSFHQTIDLAHLYRIISFITVLIGLNHNVVYLFKKVEKDSLQINSMNDKLKKGIKERKRIEVALKESEERYRLLVEQFPDIIAVVNDYKWVYMNTTGRKRLGATCKTEIIGRSVFDFIPSDDHLIIKQKAKVITQGNRQNNLLERTFIDLNGNHLDVEVQASLIKYKGKDSIQIVARDMSERKKAEEMLRQSEKLSAVGQLAAGIAHEIRNPLTSLSGFVQLLQHGSEQKEEYFNIMHSELKRIETIISELLILSKPQSVHLEKHNIKELLQHVVTLINTQAILNNVQIETKCCTDKSVFVLCEEDKLKQVFINLLKNSIEAMPKGGLITVQSKKVDNKLYIELIDQGNGIPQEQLERLGEPFYTTKENGTGLGLMISYKIIEDHNGHMKIDSKVGEGTKITIILPIKES